MKNSRTKKLTTVGMLCAFAYVAVEALLLTAFLPFNLLKGGLNAGITFLLYKPIVTTLRRLHLVET